jgi:calcium permeable stress-gated cation channel
MPLQLLNLGVIIPRVFFRLLITRTPRGNWSIVCVLLGFNRLQTDFAELNAPPVINYGTVYPQAILIFVITLLYSIAQPLILIFGAIYFGVAYLVYKYKLLFGEQTHRPVYCRSTTLI